MTENNFDTIGGISSAGTVTGESQPSTGAAMPTTGGATASEICPTCGQSMQKGGVEEMLNRLKAQFKNVDLEEYMTTARDYLKTGSAKATTFAKENPAKIAAGAAAIALGAGLLYAAMHRDKGTTIEVTRNEGEAP